jgi:glutaredoxin
MLLQLLQAHDTLFIYSKHNCSVCKQTKQVLLTRGISFVEKVVETPLNASEMLSKLALSGFKGTIYVPVIYVGKKLVYPAYTTNNGLVNLEINSVVDSLIHKFRSGEITIVDMSPITEKAIKNESDESPDCEHTTGHVYLIAANYTVEKEAINAVQVLMKYGYTNAGFVYDNNVFRVYLELYRDFASASTQLAIEKFKFTDAYLFVEK